MNNESGIRNKKKNPLIHNSKFIILNEKPDGNFPGHGPNPLVKGATEQLKKEVKRVGADLGVIFDGDGDRVFFVDNRGRLINANEIGYILTRMFKPPYVVGEVSSWRLKNIRRSDLQNIEKDYNKKLNIGRSDLQKLVCISRVGHYFFKKLMREKKATLGLEHSGHYYFKDFFYCDAGIFAAIHIINFISGLKTDLANWLDKLPKYYRSGELNFRIDGTNARKSNLQNIKKNVIKTSIWGGRTSKILKTIEKKYKNQARSISKLDGLTIEFSNWWFNLRPSNTENLLRLNMEATNKKVLDEKLREIRRIISP
jgi:phosphomannomutase